MRRGAPKLSVKILRKGVTSLLWPQSHNPNQRVILMKLCLFRTSGYYAFILQLLQSVPLINCSSPLSLFFYGISLCFLYLSFSSAKTACFCLRALCCNSNKCPGYQYFISKSDSSRIALRWCYQIQMSALSEHRADIYG